MESILIAVVAFVGYIVAYKTYGRYLARRIFDLDRDRPTAAVECEDGTDYVPTSPEILFGHHYTSIAGTGPIVGPAIGIIWGWLPALVWVVLGAIFMGAVHDFGAIVVSMRNKGRSIGDLAAGLVSPRVRMMFLALVALALTIVLAVFCLVIALVFKIYPQAVLPVWCNLPIAVALGHAIYRMKMRALPVSIAAVALMYVTVVVGAYVPLRMPAVGPLGPVVIWSVILLVYAYVASVLPVWRLLQPRDYINGHQLFIALGLLVIGTLVAHPKIVAPAVNRLLPEGAPPMWPFLFVTIACGAISGFHSLVGSGTTSKQIRCETDARVIGYGSMLMEGVLAVLVIIAVAGGFGLGRDKQGRTGADLWNHHYVLAEESVQVEGEAPKVKAWKDINKLGPKLEAFVDGSANMLAAMKIPMTVALAIMGVFVASFAATTLDTATRIQRYVVSELAAAARIKPLTGKHAATLVAVVTAGALALWDGEGKGGMILWPLFGATNQLIACLALLVITAYLKKKGKPLYFTLVPAAIMFVITGWAMVYKIGEFWSNVFVKGEYGANVHLLVIALVVVVLELWMIVETVKVLMEKRKAEEPEGKQESADALQ